MAILSRIMDFAIGIVGSIAADEAKAWIPSVVEFLIDRAVARLPKDKRERYAEEWRADLATFKGVLSKMVFAFGLGRAATKIAVLSGERRAGKIDLGLKRILDLSISVFIIVFLAPLFFVIALLVRLDSPGPVFFSHRRIASQGVFFTIWKFRTMRINSGEILENYLASNPEARREWHATHKLNKDPRVTRFGRFLRHTSLDELPQLWNVVTGSMSLVGPRPLVAAEAEKYGEAFQDYCSIKPGITGLSQLSTSANQNYRSRIELDSTYARTRSFGKDLLILLETALSVLRGH